LSLGLFFIVLLASEVQADLIKELRYNGSLFTISPSMSEAWSDLSPNSSTALSSSLMRQSLKLLKKVRLALPL
jgi:hypothetical protein